MRRGFWFVAGAGAGVYAMVRARRAAEVFTPEGLRDRVAGLNVGAHLFAEEVRVGMAERETELRERLGLALDGPLELGGGGGSEVSRLAALAPQPPEAALAPQPPEAALAPQPPDAELESRDAGVAELMPHRGFEARSARTSTTDNLEGTH
jgi:hypothetical protein